MIENVLYKSVSNENTFEFEEKRSTFIGYIAPVKTEDEAKAFIKKIKAKHHDARHNCHAYVLRDGVMRYSDDGEPQGTAGIPILEVIKKNDIVDVVVVVTRYFGGILLGAGGLVRAYSSAAAGAISTSVIASYIKCTKFKIEIEYPLYDKISKYLSDNNVRVSDIEYNEKISLTCLISADEYDSFNIRFIDFSNARIALEFLEDIIERI